MRLVALATILLAASPAVAGVPTEPRWSADVHDTEGGRARDAVLDFEALGRGWRLILTCETTDLQRHRVVARERHEGIAVRGAAGDLVLVGGLLDKGTVKVTMGFPAGDGDPVFMSQLPGCPTGRANVGTGD